MVGRPVREKCFEFGVGFFRQNDLECHEFIAMPAAAIRFPDRADRGAATQVDCLLLDIHLGGLSGIELRRRLKDSGSTLPVIFMTGLDAEAMIEQALKAGCVAFLRKPFQARQLIEAIKKAVP